MHRQTEKDTHTASERERETYELPSLLRPSVSVDEEEEEEEERGGEEEEEGDACNARERTKKGGGNEEEEEEEEEEEYIQEKDVAEAETDRQTKREKSHQHRSVGTIAGGRGGGAAETDVVEILKSRLAAKFAMLKDYRADF